MAGSKPLWRVVKPELIEWREWDGEVALFDGTSGATHLLQEDAATIFLALSESPSPVAAEQLARELSAAEGDAGELDGATAAVEAILLEFQRLGFAEILQP